MKHSLIDILTRGFKGRQYSLSGLDVSDIVIHDDLGPITQEMLEEADLELDKTDYQLERAAEYPTIAEQLDAIWHAMDQNILPKNNDFYVMRKAIKDKYPKPQ